jgi:hypothetical protein
MTKYLRKGKASLKIGIFFISLLALVTMIISSPSVSAKIISYPSIITIDIDDASLEALNTPINIESALLVKIKIGYSVGVPEKLLDEDAGLLARIWVFGSMVVFPQIIHLTIEGSPEWANIYLSTPDIFILNFSTTTQYAYADLIISPYYDAPAVPKSVTIKAEAAAIGRIQPITFSKTLNFEPDFIPLISVEVDSPVRQVGPREALNFQMTIRNMGNKEAIVRGTITDVPSEWAPLLSPTEVPVGPGQTATVTFSVTTPYNFGWHNEVRTFTISFVPEKSPPSTPPITGAPHLVQVRVNSVGFSAPGFEPILLFAAIALIIVIVKKRQKK